MPPRISTMKNNSRALSDMRMNNQEKLDKIHKPNF